LQGRLIFSRPFFFSEDEPPDSFQHTSLGPWFSFYEVTNTGYTYLYSLEKAEGSIMNAVTRILSAIEQGETQATDELLPVVYEELRCLAAQKLSKESPGHTLQATALVHEAYLRLLGPEVQTWHSRGHFFGAAAEAMRRILVDNARRKQRLKRGGDRKRMELFDAELAVEGLPDDLIVLDEALSKLAEMDSAKAELVKLRYFAGLTVEQAAQALGISESTAKAHWRFARAWLYRQMSDGN